MDLVLELMDLSSGRILCQDVVAVAVDLDQKSWMFLIIDQELRISTRRPAHDRTLQVRK